MGRCGRSALFVLALASVNALLFFAIPAPSAAQTPVPVSVVSPTSTTVNEELRLTGTLTAERSARLSPRVDGLIARIHVDAGDRVKAGDRLLEIDATLAAHSLRRMSAEVRRARAAQNEAQRLLDEARRLVKEKHLPQTELERREAEHQLATAALAASVAAEREQKEIVARHVLPAPFAGVVARRLTDLGEWVTRGTPVLELVAVDRVRLDVQAPQEYFRLINDKAPVTIRAHDLPDVTFPGRIVARVPVSDANSRAFLIRIVADQTEVQLLPGTSAQATIRLTGTTEAVVVPREAVLRYPDGSHSVFVVRTTNGRSTVHEQRVTPGSSSGDRSVEILQGLSAGDQVVVRGNQRLRNGQQVTIRNGS